MEEKKVSMLSKLKQSDESVKLAVAVGVGLTVGVVGTVAVQAYGRKRENDALRLQANPIAQASTFAPHVAVLRVPPNGQQ